MLPKEQHDAATLECPPQAELLDAMQEAGVTAVPYSDDIALGGELHIEGSKVLELGRRVGAAVEKVFGKPARGAVVNSPDTCTCGHSPEEHGRDPAFPGSTACGADLGAEGCDCAAYEAYPV